MRALQALLDTAYQTAIDAALEASRVMMPFWPNPSNSQFEEQRALQIIEKDEGIGNYATMADLLSEQRIIEVIRAKQQFTSHSISAEETGDIIGDEEWRWSIDPIDGTMNFLHGLPDFGVCIAVFNDDEVVVGVIAMPALQQMVAVKSGSRAKLLSYEGAEIADLSLLAQKHGEHLSDAIIGYNLGYADRGHQLTKIAAELVTKVGYAASVGSFATGNFRMLQGMMGAYFGMSPTVMDIAPIAALLPAVGGVVTDMSGRPIDWNAAQRTYLGAVNPQIHEQFLAAMTLP